MKKFRFLMLTAILLAVVTMNVAPVMAYADAVAVDQPASATPCADKYAGCRAGGGSESFCDGMFCACMYNTYGAIC
jgi:hypothetical protein